MSVWTDNTIDLRRRRLLTIGQPAPDQPELVEIGFDAITRRRVGTAADASNG